MKFSLDFFRLETPDDVFSACFSFILMFSHFSALKLEAYTMIFEDFI